MKTSGLSRFGVLVIVTMLAACAGSRQGGVPSLPQVPEFAAASATAEGLLPPTDAFLQTSEEMRAFVRDHVMPAPDRLERMRRLWRALLSPALLGVRYEADLTLTASETFRQRAGNCLSFSALYVALAREAGLDVAFQDVPVLPNWRMEGGAFVVERHINVLIRMGSGSHVVDFRPPAAVAYAKATRISDRNAAAQYFGNLGVERFSAGDLGGAYRLFRRGLEIDPAAAMLWVNLGVVLGRNGQFDAARSAYEAALTLEPDNLSALSNLAGLAAHLGDSARREDLESRIERYRARNPYYQYWLGERELQRGAPHDALRAFRAALRLLPQEADFHFAMARTWRELGRESEAARSFAKALERAANESTRQRYIAAFADGTAPVAAGD
jgi:Flp pilus assembly protein TadD